MSYAIPCGRAWPSKSDVTATEFRPRSIALVAEDTRWRSPPAALTNIEAGDLQAVGDAARAVDEQIPLGERVARVIPHQQRRAGEAAGRRDEVAEHVVANDPVRAGVDVHAVHVRVAGRRRVFDDRVFDDAIVD